MDQRLRSILDQTPARPPRSKLEPDYDVIRELRQKRFTYKDIAGFLHEHLGMKVRVSTIHAFLQVRKRAARAATADPAPSTPPQTNSKSEAREAIERFKARNREVKPSDPPPRFHFAEGEILTLPPKPSPPRPSPEAIAAAYEAIGRFKNRKREIQPPPPPARFHFDPEKGLTMPPETAEEKS